MHRRLHTLLSLFALAVAIANGPTYAQATTALTYVSGSSVKVEQINGDCDWQHYDYADDAGTCVATTSQTVTRYNILGNGFGYSFEDNGKMLFLFGDTISSNPSVVNYHAHDPIAWSTSTDPDSGLLLNFFTNSDGSPLFIEPPGVQMGADDICSSGISLPDAVYLVCNSGADETLADPHQNAYSVLVRFDEAAKTFAAGRTVSQLPGGHFVFTAMHALGPDVYMFGAGNYRASDIFLSKTPAATFASGAGTQYFAGLDTMGAPIWTGSEAAAVPVVQDNPLGGPAWPNDSPSVGNMSVVYSSDLDVWMMTYDGGRQSGHTRGIYFTYAAKPWGPWAAPQLIFNAVRDNAWGVYIHNPNVAPDPPGDGLNGPVIGSGNNPYTTAGGEFAPQLIERFTRVNGDTLRIYYNLSTWNPYAIVRVRSDFQIASNRPQTGWWWNASESGRGFFIEQRGATIVIAGYLYDGAGKPVWFITAGPIANGTFSGPMQTFSGGQSLDGPYVAPVPGPSLGDITVQFTSATHANVTWPGGTFAITRFQFANDGTGFPQNGWWWNAAESGRGFSIEQQGNTLFIAGYLYETGGAPIWYISAGAMSSSSTYSGGWQQFADGQAIGAPYRAPVLVNPNVGSVVLVFTDPSNALLTLPGGRVVPLTRLQF